MVPAAYAGGANLPAAVVALTLDRFHKSPQAQAGG